MFIRFNSPAARQKRLKKSWLFVVGLYVASIYLAFSWFHRDWTPHTWTMPAESQLQTASGFFSASHFSPRSPYAFITDAGNHISLGCDPEEYGADCFSDYGFLLPALAKRHVAIGYFYVYNPYRASHSNVLVTISTRRGAILSYADSKVRMSKWAIEEENIKRSWLNIVLDSLLPLFFAALATAVVVTKLSFRETGELQNQLSANSQ